MSSVKRENSETEMEKEQELCKKKISLFDFRRRLMAGQNLIKLETVDNKYLEPIVYVELPDYNIEFPEIKAKEIVIDKTHGSSTAWPRVKQLLNQTFHIEDLSAEEKGLIWTHRHNALDMPDSLPIVLHCCSEWNSETLSEIAGLLSIWPLLSPLIAVNLLTEDFVAVQAAREFSIRCLDQTPSDILLLIIPQLVTLLEFENAQDGCLTVFLLEQSWRSIRLAFYTHMALVTAHAYANRDIFIVVRELLEWSVGKSMKENLRNSRGILTAIDHNAEEIKTHRSSDAKFFSELADQLKENAPFHMAQFLPHALVSLEPEACSTFSSFTAPVKLCFKDEDEQPFKTMYKIGDDLRQDALITTLFTVMEGIWLDAGLDLRMRTFSVFPTDRNKGFIELVPAAVSLREIQAGAGNGISGSLKERPLQTWLLRQRLDWHQVVDNFTRSCAAYCVATYILGLGDRHNDNIMVTRQGHLFHIDFNKAFGHAQKFAGAIKRDRAPFVLSADMAYVINHGDKTARSFHRFVDMCTKAYNLLRLQWRTILSLIQVSVPMKMGALRGMAELRHIHDNLSPAMDEFRAQQEFTRLIREAGSSLSVKVNFFIHTMAQHFSHGNQGVKPLPHPEQYTVHEVGKPIDFELENYEKRFGPDKYFVYRIKGAGIVKLTLSLGVVVS